MKQEKVKIPAIGLGTWKINDATLMEELLKNAYEDGYRLIDTAASYSNEMIIGKAIQKLGIPREELLLSDKVWKTNYGYEETIQACRKSLKKLKTDYLDIYLIHWPAAAAEYENWKEINAETWRGMEELYKQGLVKMIGVSNFKPYQMEALRDTAEIMPMINQIELHPGMVQAETVGYCEEKHIAVEASSPLGNGRFLENEILKKYAAVEGITPAQMCLAYGHQKGITVLPKTTSAERLKENIRALDIRLSGETMEKIEALPYIGGLGLDSDEVFDYAKL